jgi:T3SS (YopN, CesT) and YbjN peptide-binding chaperone 1
LAPEHGACWPAERDIAAALESPLPMQFDSAAQEACYEQVASYLGELFADRVWASNDRPYFVLRQGSAAATVDVQAWGERSIVRTWALVVTEVKPVPDLYEFLLRLNSEQQFGAFALDPDNDIIFAHTIIGDTLDMEELDSSVEAVARCADKYDDEIVARFGGLRAGDRQDAGFADA